MTASFFPFNSDEQLLMAYKNGNSHAFNELYKRHFPKVYYQCLGYAKDKDEADDLAQEVMLKILHKLEGFGGASKLSTWIYTVTRNYCIDWYRKENKRYFQRIEDGFDIASEEILEEEETSAQNEKALLLMGQLCEVDKQMLLLKYEQGYSIKQLEDLFGLSASAVKMRLKRAKNKISSQCVIAA